MSIVHDFISHLRLQEQGLEAVEEELPGEDAAVAERVVQLVHGLQHHGPVHHHQVELRLQAVEEELW